MHAYVQLMVRVCGGGREGRKGGEIAREGGEGGQKHNNSNPHPASTARPDAETGVSLLPSI